MEVVVYTKETCSLCEKAIDLLEELKKEYRFTYTLVDIYQDDALLEKYQIMIPVVEINGEEVDFGIISAEKIRKRLLLK
ncbi:glutaredoxin family protein [Priestia koreensis]|uniref:Glutaredoxin n=1 Tax=Priestia koreensis TaxID=284581 RepID=A0A0M0KEC1_9BACI|nr:glutaredoxin family protein [Priestia koreensis]KOO37139.1 glutaredoxin [Priestia koreensis]